MDKYNFNQEQKLGGGSYGEVFPGVNIDDMDTYAIKQTSIKNKLMFENECEALVLLKNADGILQMKENIEENEYLYIITEILKNGEAYKFIELTGPFNEKLARTYFRQIVYAINECHSRNIIHRDIKGENILFDDNFNSKLIDFGLAKILNENEYYVEGETGSPNYMAPEIFTEAEYDGYKADIWALGILLFFLVIGDIPFNRAEMTNKNFYKFRIHSNKFWNNRVEMSDELKILLQLILNINPIERISLNEIMENEWFNYEIYNDEELFEIMNERMREEI